MLVAFMNSACNSKKKDDTMASLREHINSQSRHISELTEQLESINNELFMLEDRVDGNTARNNRALKRPGIQSKLLRSQESAAPKSGLSTSHLVDKNSKTIVKKPSNTATVDQPTPIDDSTTPHHRKSEHSEGLPIVKLTPNLSGQAKPTSNPNENNQNQNKQHSNEKETYEQLPSAPASRILLSAAGQRSKIVKKSSRRHLSSQKDSESASIRLSATGTVVSLTDSAKSKKKQLSSHHALTQMRLAYRHALNTLRERHIDDAISLFRGFITAYPNQSYTDNALYWLGECYYTRQQYGDAIEQFERVIREQPSGNKVPDALLKVGYSYIKLGQLKNARVVLKSVLDSFPNASVSTLARQKLSIL